MSPKLNPGDDGEHITFCRLCEASCGLIAKVEGGRITGLVPDRENPNSLGHVCVKGTNFHQVVHDPDRLTMPLRRNGASGDFEPVEWDEALDDIAERLGAIIDEHGPDAVASYRGNPLAFSADGSIGLRQFLAKLGVTKTYGVASQDCSARFVANYLLWGAALTFDVCDLPDCDLLLIFGANPLVSKGSLLNAPRLRHDLDAIAARGRVIVIDPRRNETAQRYEHVPIHPNGDAWLLAAILQRIVERGGVDEAFVNERCTGWPELRARLLGVDLPRAADRSGVPLAKIDDLAEAFANTPRAAVYGRIGLCRGPFATLENVLLSVLNIVTGKFGRPGGSIFPVSPLASGTQSQVGGYGETRSRIGDIPSAGQILPSAMLPADMTEPGPGRVRVLISTGGNMLRSAPGGEALSHALPALDLFVSIDLYRNETNGFADYILPATTFLERDDVALAGLAFLIRPFIQLSEAVLPPVGEARAENDILTSLLRKMGRIDADSPPPRPMNLIDEDFRKGPAGDLKRGADGWSFEKLRAHPHGVMLDLPDPYDKWDRIAWPDRKFHLWHELLGPEFDRLQADFEPQQELKLVTHRDVRSMNSWLHNVDRLVRSQAPVLKMNSADAAQRNLASGDLARIANSEAEIIVAVEVTDEMIFGCVSYPHGWQHDGGWSLANRSGGANINALLGHGIGMVERLSGTTIMDGIAVEVTALPKPSESPI